MPTTTAKSLTWPLRSRGAVLLLFAASGCAPDDATEMVRQINAARDGCTREMLSAGDEECVQMFEEYIGMGTEMMEDYIGAMRSFEEALDRRGNIQFDTAGFGHALTPESLDGLVDSLTLGRRLDGSVPGYRPVAGLDGPAWEDAGVGASPESGALLSPTSDGWLGTSPTSGGGADGGLGQGDPALGRSRASTAPDDAAAWGTGAVTPPRRGAILPPSERLRRPWIEDELLPNGDTPDGPDRDVELEKGARVPQRAVDPYDDGR